MTTRKGMNHSEATRKAEELRKKYPGCGAVAARLHTTLPNGEWEYYIENNPEIFADKQGGVK